MAASLLLRHAEPVVSVHFTGDGSRVVTATDQRATIWDTATGVALYTSTDIGNYLADALLLPGDRQLFQAGIAFGESCLLDVLTGQMTTTSVMIQAQCAVLAPRQRGILIASWDDQLRGAAQLLDDQTLRLRRNYATGDEGMIIRVVVSAGASRFLALRASLRCKTPSARGRIPLATMRSSSLPWTQGYSCSALLARVVCRTSRFFRVSRRLPRVMRQAKNQACFGGRVGRVRWQASISVRMVRRPALPSRRAGNCLLSEVKMGRFCS